MVKMLCFDLDGTLLNTILDIGEAMNESLKFYGFPTHPIEDYPKFIGGGINRLIINASLKEDLDSITLNNLKTLFLQTYDANLMAKTRPFLHMFDVLKALKAKGYLLGVISNKVHFQSVKLIDYFFPNLFDYVAGQKEDVKLKPDSEAMELMAKEFDLTNDEIIYFGDSKTDAQFCLNANVKYFLFEYGYEDKTVLHQYKPIKFLKDAEEILEYF